MITLKNPGHELRAVIAYLRLSEPVLINGSRVYRERIHFADRASSSAAYRVYQDIALEQETGACLSVRLIPKSDGFDLELSHDERTIAMISPTPEETRRYEERERRRGVVLPPASPAGDLHAYYANRPVCQDDIGDMGQLVHVDANTNRALIRNYCRSWRAVIRPVVANRPPPPAPTASAAPLAGPNR